MFKHINIKFGFRCCNTIAQLTKPATDHKIPPHNKGGIYQLTCKSCNLPYVGQISCSLKICFQEYIRYIRSNNPQSAYAQHILQNQHKYDTLNELTTLLKPLKYKNMLIPYKQILQSVPPPSRQTHSRTIPRCAEPSIPTGCPHTPPPLHTTRQSQSGNIPQPGRITYSPAPDQRPVNQRYVRLILWLMILCVTLHTHGFHSTY